MSGEIETAIFTVMDEYGDESGKMLIEDIYRLLKREYDIDRVSAGKIVIELCKVGKISSVDYYHLRRS